MSKKGRTPFDQLNNSVSKMMYSFSKAQRFSPSKASMNQQFYDLPKCFGDGRKTSIGYGKKSELCPRLDFTAPSPTKYDIKSIFDAKSTKGTKFGFGRDEIKMGSILSQSIGPGPAAYSIPSKMKEHAEVSIGTKLKNIPPLNHDDPGPGAYKLPSYFSQAGNYMLSTLRNSSVPNMKEHKTDSKKKHIITPGPGYYEIKQNVTTGDCFNSKYSSSRLQTFGKVPRKIFQTEDSMGPGAYNRYSEFDT